ncbi:hypothetical protein ACSIAY_004914 [Escherichia coli]
MNLLVRCAGKIPALALTWTCRPCDLTHQ